MLYHCLCCTLRFEAPAWATVDDSRDMQETGCLDLALKFDGAPAALVAFLDTAIGSTITVSCTIAAPVSLRRAWALTLPSFPFVFRAFQ
jgi:hypothetical protein